jgi:hypothetical protein
MGSKTNDKDVDTWNRIIDWLDADQQTDKLKVVADNT